MMFGCRLALHNNGTSNITIQNRKIYPKPSLSEKPSLIPYYYEIFHKIYLASYIRSYEDLPNIIQVFFFTTLYKFLIISPL